MAPAADTHLTGPARSHLARRTEICAVSARLAPAWGSAPPLAHVPSPAPCGCFATLLAPMSACLPLVNQPLASVASTLVRPAPRR